MSASEFETTMGLCPRCHHRVETNCRGGGTSRGNGRWIAALACVAALQQSVEAFAPASQVGIINIHNNGGTSSVHPLRHSSPLHYTLTQAPFATTTTTSIDDSVKNLSERLWGHDRLRSPVVTTTMSGSTMFIKPNGISVMKQPMSSLSSDFYELSSPQRPWQQPSDNGSSEEGHAQTTRGVLGFALHDYLSDDRDTASSSSSALFSSTDHSREQRQQHRQPQQSPTSPVDFKTWNVPKTWDDDWGQDRDSWIPTTHGRASRPLLNAASTGSFSRIPAWFPWIPTRTQIDALKVVELKSICAERGLKQMGNKDELRERLWEWTQLQQKRRLVIGGSSAFDSPGTMEGLRDRINSQKSATTEEDTASEQQQEEKSPPNSLDEWARTFTIESLSQRREKIHQQKREGKEVPRNHKSRRAGTRDSAPATPTKEYLSKLFLAPASQYSNLEVMEMYAAAKAADQAGDRVLTKQILMRLKEATPHDARIYRRLARLEQEEGHANNARSILQEGIRLHPSNSHLRLGLGKLESKAGRHKEARACFMQAVELDPTFPNAYHALGILEHHHGRIANAMKILKKGLEYCPSNHRLHHALGDLYREAKLLDMAEKSFRRALEHGPPVSRGFAYTSLAHVAYEQNNIDKCRSWLRKAVLLNDGRHAKTWLAWSMLEESEGNLDVARTVCMAALDKYERELIRQSRRYTRNMPSSSIMKSWELVAMVENDPEDFKNQLVKSVPVYRSGDHFLKLYRNWARLEERVGTSDSVDEVYTRASIAFPTDWKLILDWARYHALKGHMDRARLLFAEACTQASNRHADPYRVYAEYEMCSGNYQDARTILYSGARAVSQCPDGALNNNAGMAELFHAWAVCEWHLENISRAEVLFDHALRLTNTGEEGAELRSFILHSVARLQYNQGDYHLAQHYIGLCLKENAMPGGTSVVWDLWTVVASSMGDTSLARQCEKEADKARVIEGGSDHAELSRLLTARRNGPSEAAGLSKLSEKDMQFVMRKDPWHHKLFNTKITSPSWYSGLKLPDLVD